jgi:pSer/pThr/pTyr-binding forkhead associated (FHA) protein
MSDLASTNGTYVNGERLTAGMLKEGDQLMVGKFHLRISRGHG